MSNPKPSVYCLVTWWAGLSFAWLAAGAIGLLQLYGHLPEYHPGGFIALAIFAGVVAWYRYPGSPSTEASADYE